MNETKTTDLVRGHLIESLLEIQRQSGRETPQLGDESIPLDDLPGFDSVNGVEVEVLLSLRLGIDLKHLPFVDPRDRHLTIGEIALAVAQEHAPRLRSSAGADIRAVGA